MPGIPPQSILPFLILTILCLISTILAFTVVPSWFPGDENYSKRAGAQATYTLYTILYSICCVFVTYMVIRGSIGSSTGTRGL